MSKEMTNGLFKAEIFLTLNEAISKTKRPDYLISFLSLGNGIAELMDEKGEIFYNSIWMDKKLEDVVKNNNGELIGIPDLNINVDVEATKYVLKHGGNFPIYPNEVMDEIKLSRSDYYKIKNSGSLLGKFLGYELNIHNFLFNEIAPIGGIIPHGVVSTGLALDLTYDCKYIESAVEMRNFGSQGYAFVLSNNPNLPKHKIYYKLNKDSKKRIHKTLLERCI